MAMASLSSMVALSRGAPLPGTHPPSLQRQRRARVVACSALPPASRLVQERVGGVLLPLFAAALIGSAPVLEAVVAPHAAVADVETDNLDSYKDLLRKIKEKKGRQGFQPQAPATAPVLGTQPEQPSVSPAAARLKEAAEKARQEREAESIRAEKREAEKREAEQREVEKREAEKQAEARRTRETAASIAERERAAVEKVAREKAGVASITIKKKTHGFLPLFVSQFFLLLATLGVGAVLFVLPEKQLKEIQDKVDDFVDKATPVAEDVYTKAKPVAEQAWAKAQEAGVAAKPYVEKAWEQAKPMAAKAVEASKPLIREAQVKANELLQEAQKKSK